MSPRRASLMFVLTLCGCGGPAFYARGLQALGDGSCEEAAAHLAPAFRSSRGGRVGMELARARALAGDERSALRAAERAWVLGVRGSDAVEFARALSRGGARDLWFERALEAIEKVGRGRLDLAALAEVVREYEAFPKMVLRACLCARRRFREQALGRALSGRAHALDGDMESAEKSCRSSLAQDPGCVEAARGLGLILARTNRQEQAAALALRLLRTDASARARLAAAEVALEAGRTALAEEFLNPLLASENESGARAVALLSRTRLGPRERLSFLLDARGCGLDSPELRVALAETYSSLGNARRLVREGREGLEEFPSSGRLARKLAELGESWGEPELTGAALHALGPRARPQLARELARAGKGKAALRAARGDPAASGLALASCGRMRAAAGMLEEAGDARSLHELGWLKLSLGELEEALRAWRSALALEPGFGPARFELWRWKVLRGGRR